MNDAFDDEQLAQAIAASLQNKPLVGSKAQEPEFIEISDDEDESVQNAMTSRATAKSKPSAAAAPPPSNPINSFLAERAQLEKERRERARKYRQAAGLKDDDEGSDGEAASTTTSRKAATVKGKAKASTPTVDPTEQLFFDGELRPTAVQGAEPRRDGKPTFRLTQALGKKSDISFAILSSYAHDITWAYSFFEPAVPVIILTQPETNSAEVKMKTVLPHWIKVTPKLGVWGCQHMKFMIIFYKTGRLRVVVSTANLVPFDYRDIENVLWLQDIPPRQIPIPNDTKEKEDFPSTMQRVLNSMGVKEALTILGKEHSQLPINRTEDLRCRWDWSKVKVHLVPSIAGKHEGWPDVVLTGHPCLMKAVRNLGLHRRAGEVALECQGSSIGNYSSSWLNEFYHSALGRSAEDWLRLSKAKQLQRPIQGKISIVFPSRETVRASKFGEPGGGTIFCRRNQWEGLRKLGSRVGMYDSKSLAGNVLMHTKMILGILKVEDDDSDESDIEIVDSTGKKEEPAIAWAYVGSHNFTPSAWGNVSGSAFNPVLNIKNYEIGIVFPIRSKEELEKVTFWERPPKKYGSGDVPWMQEESLAFAR